MTEKTFNKAFSAFILVGMSVCVVLSCIFKLREPDTRVAILLLTSFGALMGVASTVLAANGSIWNFLFGLLDICIYSYALYDSNMPTQFLLHVLYLAPMNVVGFFQWKKRGASAKSKVRARRVTPGKALLFLGIFVSVYAATFLLSHFLLDSTGETNTLKACLDAAVTTANITALVMMAFAYAEQWYLWIIVNVCSIIIWAMTLASVKEAGYAIVPLVKYIFYLINSVNGIRMWMKLSREADSCITE